MLRGGGALPKLQQLRDDGVGGNVRLERFRGLEICAEFGLHLFVFGDYFLKLSSLGLLSFLNLSLLGLKLSFPGFDRCHPLHNLGYRDAVFNFNLIAFSPNSALGVLKIGPVINLDVGTFSNGAIQCGQFVP